MSSTKGEHIYSVDWGTSSLRVRLIDLETNEIISQVKTNQGVYSVFNLWQNQLNSDKSQDRIEFYLAHLKGDLEKLKHPTQGSLEGIPVIISGMASSSIGIIELPYAELPFAVSGTSMVVHTVDASKEFNHQVLILSGVKGENEVMRGEETQLVGVANLMPELREESSSIVLFPGTHSKHLYISKGYINKIETYITGELFDILSKNGLLKEAVEVSNSSLGEGQWEQAFMDGVAYSENIGLLRGLFKIRVNQLFNQLDKVQNYSYFSGLLIGCELRNLLDKKNARIFLCSGDNLYKQYKLAIDQLGLSSSTYITDADVVERATVQGQVVIARQYLTQLQKSRIDYVKIR